MSFDFNNAGPQRSFDIIPADTVATLQLNIRPGHAGDGGWLKRSKAGDSEALDCEFIVVDGEFAKRKFWTLFTVSGTTDGHASAADISRRRLRAILESARGITPDDNGEAANQGRRTESWAPTSSRSPTAQGRGFFMHDRSQGNVIVVKLDFP